MEVQVVQKRRKHYMKNRKVMQLSKIVSFRVVILACYIIAMRLGSVKLFSGGLRRQLVFIQPPFVLHCFYFRGRSLCAWLLY